jgi:hypothetical protein
MQPKLCRVRRGQKFDAMRLNICMAILFLAAQASVCAGTCHISPCDALQEMRNEIVKFSSANVELTHGESLEIRLAQLERRVRSVEQPSMWKHVTISCFYIHTLEYL